MKEDQPMRTGFQHRHGLRLHHEVHGIRRLADEGCVPGSFSGSAQFCRSEKMRLTEKQNHRYGVVFGGALPGQRQ
jgi:hypothetical protein